jgi:hypothetical protein
VAPASAALLSACERYTALQCAASRPAIVDRPSQDWASDEACATATDDAASIRSAQR